MDLAVPLLFVLGVIGRLAVFLVAALSVFAIGIYFFERKAPNRVDMRLSIWPGGVALLALLLGVPSLLTFAVLVFAFVLTLATMHYLDFGFRGFLRVGAIACAVVLAPVVYLAAPGAYLAVGAATARILPLPQGDPPYRTLVEERMSPVDRFIAARFKEPSDCLQAGADPDHSDDLLKMDWDRINNQVEVEVCIFRLMHAVGGIEGSRRLVEAQGFTVGREALDSGHSPENPSVIEGSLEILATWSIVRNGPLFPTRGFIRRKLNALHEEITVSISFDESGETVLGVSIYASPGWPLPVRREGPTIF